MSYFDGIANFKCNKTEKSVVGVQLLKKLMTVVVVRYNSCIFNSISILGFKIGLSIFLSECFVCI